MSTAASELLAQFEKPRTVEDYLNDIDYTDDPNYIPTDFALSFVNFIKLCTDGEGEENETPVVHYEMLDKIARGDKRIANMCFRGLGKTSLFAEYFILYLAVYRTLPNFGDIDLIIYVSDSIENGVKNLRKNLEFRWENSDFLKQYIPSIRFTDIRLEFNNADGNRLIVRSYGAKTGVRGTKEMGKRPQLAILDDLVSDEDARSDTVIASIEDTVYKAIDYALHPSKKMMIWSGTPFNSKDPLYKAVNSGTFAVSAYPVCEKFPCTREEFKGAWTDRFDFDYVQAQYSDALRSGKIDTFNQELMLRIMSEEDRLVPDDCIKWYSLSQLLAKRSQFNFFLTTDFATSSKQSADLSVLSMWAYNSNADWFYVDGVARRQTMDKNIDDLFRLVLTWKPQLTGIEVSGQQQGFIAWIQKEMMQRKVFFNLASDKNSNQPGIRPNTNKLERFNIVLPEFKAGKFYFPTELRETEAVAEMINELQLLAASGPKSKFDDALDTIAMLGSMKVWKPSGESDAENLGNSYDDDDVRDYWGKTPAQVNTSTLDSYLP